MRFSLSLFFMLAALWAGIWNGLAHRLFQGAAPGWIILEAALCVLLLAECCGMRFWHRKSRELKLLRRQQEEEARERNQYTSMEREQQRYKEQQEKQARRQAVEELLQIQLLEKQTELMNLQEERREWEVSSEEEQEYEEQVRGYELAFRTLEQLSQETYQDTRARMEKEMSQIL